MRCSSSSQAANARFEATFDSLQQVAQQLEKRLPQVKWPDKHDSLSWLKAITRYPLDSLRKTKRHFDDSATLKQLRTWVDKLQVKVQEQETLIKQSKGFGQLQEKTHKAKGQLKEMVDSFDHQYQATDKINRVLDSLGKAIDRERIRTEFGAFERKLDSMKQHMLQNGLFADSTALPKSDKR